MVLVVFVVSNLSLSPVIGFSNGLFTPLSWELINIINDDSLPSPNLASSAPQSIKKFSEDFPP